MALGGDNADERGENNGTKMNQTDTTTIKDINRKKTKKNGERVVL